MPLEMLNLSARPYHELVRKGIKTVAFVGSKPCAMKELADATIAVPADVSNKIQEMHLLVGHYICGEIEKRFYSLN